tara:strand:- start:1283 stop:2278 length:996 start_codon:yes stop_codon:yes gene_type:complete
MKHKILVTGSAGFIGFHLSKNLLLQGYSVYGVDNLNNSYGKKIKKERLIEIKRISKKNNLSYHFEKLDLKNKKKVIDLFKKNNFKIVIHLAAQAGVRESILKSNQFFKDNVIGFLNLMEGCKIKMPAHLLYASSSAVYGNRKKAPFSEKDDSDNPASFYGVTKKTNEIMAFTFSNLYSIPTTGLRFFTVYGPYGRPDMAYYKFTKSILNNHTIEAFEKKKMYRDFIYINDVLEAIVKLINKPPSKKDNYVRILNIGNNKAIRLDNFIKIIEEICSKPAKVIDKKMPEGDVFVTKANIKKINKLIKFKPKTSIRDGLKEFIKWYKIYKKNKF